MSKQLSLEEVQTLLEELGLTDESATLQKAVDKLCDTLTEVSVSACKKKGWHCGTADNHDGLILISFSAPKLKHRMPKVFKDLDEGGDWDYVSSQSDAFPQLLIQYEDPRPVFPKKTPFNKYEVQSTERHGMSCTYNEVIARSKEEAEWMVRHSVASYDDKDNNEDDEVIDVNVTTLEENYTPTKEELQDIGLA